MLSTSGTALARHELLLILAGRRVPEAARKRERKRDRYPNTTTDARLVFNIFIYGVEYPYSAEWTMIQRPGDLCSL
jgi:hypothetical protein